MARAQALEQKGQVQIPTVLLPSSVAVDESLSLSVLPFFVSEVGINSAYTSYGVDLMLHLKMGLFCTYGSNHSPL